MYTYKLNIESLTWEGQALQKILKDMPSLVFHSEGRICPSVWDDIGVEFIFDHQEFKYEFLRLPQEQDHLLHNISILPGLDTIYTLSVDAVSDLNEIAEREEFRRLFPKYFFSEILTIGHFINRSKMYILIKDKYVHEVDEWFDEWFDDGDGGQYHVEENVLNDLPVGIAIVVASHASLSTWLRFVNHPSPVIRYRIKSWARNGFIKVVCKVSENQFESSKMCEFHNVITESSLDNAEIAIAFLPRHEYPEFFSGFYLYK